MTTAKAFLLAATATLCAACSKAPPSPTVSIRGKEIFVEWVRTDPQRRTAPVNHPRLRDGRGILVGWPVDRLQHHYSTGSSADFEVLFLAADGRVVERQTLPADSQEGVTSKVEARYALFLPEGWPAGNGAADADRVTFSEAITGRPADPMPEVKFGDATLRVEIAAETSDQKRGLMHRRAMSADDGMLFVYPYEDDRGFWMGNCHYALDIAFFDRNGDFINLAPMEPYPDPRVDTGSRAESSKPAQYVVEANKGWFRANGLVDAEGRPTRPFRIEISELAREVARRRASW